MYVISGNAGTRRPLGTSRSTWVLSIKMDLGEIEWGGMN
jgi:hypothetical protein